MRRGQRASAFAIGLISVCVKARAARPRVLGDKGVAGPCRPVAGKSVAAGGERLAETAAILKFVTLNCCPTFSRVMTRILKPLNILAEAKQFSIASVERLIVAGLRNWSYRPHLFSLLKVETEYQLS